MDIDWIERKDVQRMFSLTTKQFGRVLKNIKRRHKFDYYLWIERDKDNKLKMYIYKECIEWLTKVYFNKEVHYLTSEIKFYREKMGVNLERI